MKIHPIQTGRVSVKRAQREGGRGRGPARLMSTLLDKQWSAPLPIYAWVVEHPEGIIVVDTGETARTGEPGYFPGWHPYFQLGVQFLVEPEEEIGPQLDQLGIRPRDVRWLVMTHLHTDHAGGLHHFPGVEILVSRTEYRLASGLAGRLRGFLPNQWPAWFAPRLVDFTYGPVGPFPESFRLTRAGDVHLVPTPGHTAGHLSLIVQDGDHSYFIAGDTSYTEGLMLDGVVDGVTLNYDEARATLWRTRQYAAENRTIYLPSHDPEAVDRLRRQQTATADETVARSSLTRVAHAPAV